MTAQQVRNTVRLNLNTTLLALSIAGGVWVVARFLVPLERVPEKIEQIERSQVKQATQIEEVYRRLGRIETK